MKRTIALTLISAFGLLGCATTHHHSHPEAVDLSSYEDGFRAGCESGIWYDLSEIKEKDFGRTMSDRAYMHGWDEGFSECRYNIYYNKNC
ncbi:MAG TPA: hypothetical protein VFP93_04090 [Gammaproteobacteria bacterium]|nr:hypothetical protein [Gammaproteobacteria bacterium]